MSARPGDDRFVFNVVWTGRVFRFLRYFVASQIAQSDARFRFVVNGCAPDQIPMLEEFRDRHAGRVLEVLVVGDDMRAHGVALDETFDQRHDGDYFCFIDPDILARGPFVAEFARSLADGIAGVTSGRGVWRDDDVIPPGQAGVSGEYFYAPDGFLFGSPHFAMYRREPIEATRARWGIGFRSAGPDLPDEAKQRLVDIGRRYFLYDTGKILNIFLQEEGYTLRHFEHDALVHIGGLSHYLSPPEGGGGAESPEWLPDQTTWPWAVTRLEVAQFTAAVLWNLDLGRAAPPLPADVDPAVAPRLEMVRDELIKLVQTYREDVCDA